MGGQSFVLWKLGSLQSPENLRSVALKQDQLQNWQGPG